MNKKKRAVITGIGIVSSIGIGKETFWQSLISGKSGIGRITSFDASSFPSKIAAEVKNFDPLNFLSSKKAATMDRSVQFAVAAAKMAKDDANLLIDNCNKDTIHVTMGTAIGGLIWVLKQEELLLSKGFGAVHPYSASVGMSNSCSAEISIALGIHGASESFSVGCTSTHSCLGYALKKIRNSETKVVIVGGTDAPLYPLPFASLCVMKVLSLMNENPEKACRPFDFNRDGTVLGEGAAVLIVEEEEHALKRGANIYAEVVGSGLTCDAYHILQNNSHEHAAKAIETAIEDANISKDDVSFINAHGISIRKTDVFESRAIKAVFGKTTKIPVVSIKSMIGHPLSAAGAIQLAVSALAIKNNIIPGTLNFEQEDPECSLHINTKSESKLCNVIICNSFAFAGKNACTVLKKYKKL